MTSGPSTPASSSSRLADSLSPYLRRHSDTKVEWWPWGAEAFEEARRRDVPVLLSVGYASCHWCHVMADESFGDAQTAGVMNTGFVNVAVDREELPGVDAVYLRATQALTGRGGWPMTVVMTPDQEPFFAGTYQPAPQFLQTLVQLAEAWAGNREEVLASARRITDTLRAIQADETSGREFTADDVTGAHADPLTERLAMAEETIADEADWEHGGFGQAPKFPPSMTLDWLLRHHARTGTPRALQMVETTGEAMARGGMFDQLRGGFARYSVDEEWAVPHFEKMLYDNAQLLAVYAAWHEAIGSPLAGRVAAQTADFLLRDLRTQQGAFASSLDADTKLPTGSVEGFTYVWTPAALNAVLGEEDGAMAAALLSVTERGTFEGGTSVLQLRDDPEGTDGEAWWAETREQLLKARNLRPQPTRDDKVVASWNGLAITGLVRAARALNRPELLEAATAAAECVLDVHVTRSPTGRPVRVSLDGQAGTAPAAADDLGNLAAGLLALHQATGEQRWADAARGLLDEALTHYADGRGGFNDVPDYAPELLLTPQTVSDNAEPCGGSALAGALIEYGRRFDSSRHTDAGLAALAAGLEFADTQPRFAGHYLAVAEQVASG